MQWFADAPPVPDLLLRSCDAEFIFDDDSDCPWLTLEWRECDVPVSAFGLTAQSLDEHLTALLPLATLAEEHLRVQTIHQWMQEQGGVYPALLQSPLLITLRNGTVKIEDGYHRLGLAVFTHGATTVRALCAAYPSRT